LRLSKSWIIASKDFKTFVKKKNIIYSIVVLPLIISFLLPVVIDYVENYRKGEAVSRYPNSQYFCLRLLSSTSS